MSSPIIIRDSDDESGNENGKQGYSMKSLSRLANTSQSTGAPSEARQHDPLHDSADSTVMVEVELLNRDIRDARRALMEQTPNWKMPALSMSTSPSNTQRSLKHHLESVEKRPGPYESNTQSSANATNDTRQQGNSQTTSSDSGLRKLPRSNPRSEQKDPWEFPGSSASDYNPVADTGELRPRKAGIRVSVKEGPAKKAKRGTALEDTYEEEEDVWKPARNAKVLGEPSSRRATRRQGSAGLVDGLKKRKRRERANEIDSGSGTELSLVSKRLKKDSPSRRGGSLNTSSFLVDLARSDNVLSDSQKQQYECISVESSSMECPPLLSLDSTGEPDLAGKVPNTDLAQAQGQTGPEDSTFAGEITPHSTSAGHVSGINDAVPRAKPSLVIELQSSASETSRKGTTTDPCNEEMQDLGSLEDVGQPAEKSSYDTQSTRENKKHKIVRSEPKSKKSKKTRSKQALSDKQQVIEEDESEAAKIGLPLEQYKPRPSRSRAKRITDEIEAPNTNIENPAEADEEKAPITTLSPRKKRKKSSRKKPTATEPNPPSTGQQLKAEDDTMKQLDEPLHEVDKKEVHPNTSTNRQTVAPTTPIANEPQSEIMKPDNLAPDNTAANEKTAATSLPSPRSPEKAKTTATKAPHSPLSNGRVPYRVGLSKKVKIQPLLRTMKR